MTLELGVGALHIVCTCILTCCTCHPTLLYIIYIYIYIFDPAGKEWPTSHGSTNALTTHFNSENTSPVDLNAAIAGAGYTTVKSAPLSCDSQEAPGQLRLCIRNVPK